MSSNSSSTSDSSASTSSVAAPLSRESSIYLARLSEQAERYEEMVIHTRHLVVSFPDITVEERNLFSIALKNFVASRRAAWRILSFIEKREEKKGNTKGMEMSRETREKVSREVEEACLDATEVIKAHLLNSSKEAEDQVFFNKMLGDYYRYLCETTVSPKDSPYADQSHQAYQLAWNQAEKDLSSTHPTSLGLALNFAVFYYDIFASPRRASHLAKFAFDQAIADLDLLTEDEYRDSTMIMQLLRDNLILWSSEPDEEEDASNPAA